MLIQKTKTGVQYQYFRLIIKDKPQHTLTIQLGLATRLARDNLLSYIAHAIVSIKSV